MESANKETLATTRSEPGKDGSKVEMAKEAKLEKAEAKLEKAKAEFQKAEAKLEKAKAEFQKAEAKLEKAEAKLEKAKAEVKEAKAAEVKEAEEAKVQEEAKKEAEANLAVAKRILDAALVCLESAAKEKDAFTDVLVSVKNAMVIRSDEVDNLVKGMMPTSLKVDSNFSLVYQAVEAVSPRSLCPWPTERPRSITVRPNQHRKTVALHYGRYQHKSRKCKNQAQCHVTGVWGNGEQVKCAHLLPHASKDYQIEGFDIHDFPDGVNNVRNSILLAKNIERAFDLCEISFLLDPEEVPGRFVVKIWNGSIRGTPIFDGSTKTIGEFDGKKFDFPADKMPFTRLLSVHTQLSFRHAQKQNWIDPNEKEPAEFGSPLKNDTIVSVCKSSFGPRRTWGESLNPEECYSPLADD